MKKVIASLVAALAISSTVFAGGNYKVDVKAPATATKGQKASVMVHIEGTNGFHVNTQYAVSLKITPPAGVQVDKATMAAGDASKFAAAGADFEIKFTSADAGTKAFTGELKFAVTNDKDVTPTTEKLAFSVTVK